MRPLVALACGPWLLGCEPLADQLLAIAPAPGGELPTNGVVVVETRGDVPFTAERSINGERVESLTKLTTRCIDVQTDCYTPLPVGPAPSGAEVDVTIHHDAEGMEAHYLFGSGADEIAPQAAHLEGAWPRPLLVIPDDSITLVMIEDDEGRVLHAELAPPPRARIEVLVEDHECVTTLTMDRAGNLTFSNDLCLE